MEINGVALTEDMMWALVIAGIFSYLVRAFYCNTLKKTLDLVAEENRCIKPSMVWLALIPLFSIYWNFVIASRMADSLTNEFYDRKIAEEESPGKNTGISYAIFIVLANIPISQSFYVVAGVFSLYFFIKYWIKIDNFRALLKEHNRYLANKKDQQEHETI